MVLESQQINTLASHQLQLLAISNCVVSLTTNVWIGTVHVPQLSFFSVVLVVQKRLVMIVYRKMPYTIRSKVDD
eukprot:m.364355 g.364355  ORF g.364355 m.364355 type:complete len:74 (-) comp26732_c0_seq1:31-252(-)